MQFFSNQNVNVFLPFSDLGNFIHVHVTHTKMRRKLLYSISAVLLLLTTIVTGHSNHSIEEDDDDDEYHYTHSKIYNTKFFLIFIKAR